MSQLTDQNASEHEQLHTAANNYGFVRRMTRSVPDLLQQASAQGRITKINFLPPGTSGETIAALEDHDWLQAHMARTTAEQA